MNSWHEWVAYLQNLINQETHSCTMPRIAKVCNLKNTTMEVYHCSSTHFLRGKIMLQENRHYNFPLYMAGIHLLVSLFHWCSLRCQTAKCKATAQRGFVNYWRKKLALITCYETSSVFCNNRQIPKCI